MTCGWSQRPGLSLAEVLGSTSERPAARDLLVTADRWYTGAGGGDGAALVASLLATLADGSAAPEAAQEAST